MRWLETPVPVFEPPGPEMVALPYATWMDSSNTIDVIDGIRWSSDRQPDRFTIDATVDRAMAMAIDRLFGRAKWHQPPETWSFNDGQRAYLDRLMEAHEARIEGAYGFRVSAGLLAPDLDWIVAKSVQGCRPTALAVVRAFTGRDPSLVDSRGRLEALTSYVQNAIPYRFIDEQERSRSLGEAKERFDLMTPLMTLLQGGDCDSKCLLLATLLRSIDPDLPLAMVTGEDCGPGGKREPHAVLAVGLPGRAGEATRQWQGTSYILIESTYDWDVGRLSPTFSWAGFRIDPIR